MLHKLIECITWCSEKDASTPADKMNTFLTLVHYNAWSNAQIFDLCAKLTDLDYRQDRKVFFGSIHNTLNHILLVDILYLSRLKGTSANHIHSLDQILYGDLATLTAARKKKDQMLTEYVQNLHSESLGELISYQRMDSQSTVTHTVQEILLTLFNHQTHHRGQVHAMVTQAGINKNDLPGIDLVDYLSTKVPASFIQ